MKLDQKKRKGAPDDPMETFDMVNRHTEKLLRQAASRRRPPEGRASGGKPSGGKLSGGKPSGGRPTGGKPSGGKPSGGKKRRPSGDRPARPGTGPQGGSPGTRRAPGQKPVKARRRKVSREDVIHQNVRKHAIRHKKNYILYYLLLAILLLGVGLVLSLTVFFKIERFRVEAAGIPEEALIEAAGIHVGDNLFRISTDRAARSIVSQFITLDGAKVSRRLPDTVVIETEPAQLLAVVRYGSQYYSVSKGSRVIGVSEERPEAPGVPVVVGCDFSDVELGDYLSDMDVERNKLTVLSGVMAAIEENTLKNVGYVDVSNIAFIKLYYEDRLEIKMGNLTDFSYELGRVKQLIREKVPENGFGVIDATLHNGVYYYRDTGEIVLPLDGKDRSQTSSGGTAGYDMPGDGLPEGEQGE